MTLFFKEFECTWVYLYFQDRIWRLICNFLFFFWSNPLFSLLYVNFFFYFVGYFLPFLRVNFSLWEWFPFFLGEFSWAFIFFKTTFSYYVFNFFILHHIPFSLGIHFIMSLFLRTQLLFCHGSCKWSPCKFIYNFWKYWFFPFS